MTNQSINVPFLRRVTLARKMSLLILMFLLPTAALLYMLVPKALEERAFTQSELRGTEFMPAVRKLLDAVQRHRGTSQLAIAGDVAAQGRLADLRPEADKALSDLHTIGAKNATLGLSDDIKALGEQWRGLQAAKMTAPDSFNAHTQLISGVLELFKHIADSSNLILDPELETYYLMDASIINVPELAEHLGIIRARASGAATRKEVSPVERIELTLNWELAKEHQAAVAGAINKVIGANRDLQNLQGKAKELDAAMAEFNDFMSRDIMRTGSLTVPPPQVFDAVSKPIAMAYQLYDQIQPALVSGLERRTQVLTRNVIIAWALFALGLLATVLAVLISRGTVRPLDDAVSVASAVASGQLDNHIDTSGADETARLMQALERMQRELKARIETEQAIAGENLRIRSALDNASTNIMIADRRA